MNNFRDTVLVKGDIIMYHITDIKSAVKAVQRLLLLNETGIYDESTKEAVRKNQEKSGLPATGIVDFATFNAIKNRYREEGIKKRTYSLSPLELNKFPYEFGMHHHDVSILNAMIANKIDKYSLPLQKPRGSFYTRTTGNAVELLREIFLLNKGRYIDEIFFYKLKAW